MGQGTLLKHLGITPKGDAHNAIYDAENLRSVLLLQPTRKIGNFKKLHFLKSRMATIALVEKMTGERDEDTCVEYLTRARETTAQKKQFYWTYQQMEEKVIQANLNVTKVTRE